MEISEEQIVGFGMSSEEAARASWVCRCLLWKWYRQAVTCWGCHFTFTFKGGLFVL